MKKIVGLIVLPDFFYFSMADVGLSQNCRNMWNIPEHTNISPQHFSFHGRLDDQPHDFGGPILRQHPTYSLMVWTSSLVNGENVGCTMRCW